MSPVASEHDAPLKMPRLGQSKLFVAHTSTPHPHPAVARRSGALSPNPRVPGLQRPPPSRPLDGAGALGAT
jgi:hypothetical protein